SRAAPSARTQQGYAMEELREEPDDGTVVRVAAVDIGKASGMVCLRVPHDTIEGRRIQKVWTVASTTNAILELGDTLVCQGVERIVMAEIGADMNRFPTPEHSVSWAKLYPRTIQSGAKNTSGPAGQGNPWLKGALGEATNAASRTDTFLGARYRRIVKRRGHTKALVAVARSILVITWHLINDPDASYQELGADWHRRHLDPARRTRDLVRQLQALGHHVALTPTAA
ncbi:transposase, partial [Streptomyces sp. NPDC059161]|uniref:transposase n=1 Tax=Streptomyces sp. NPDC059161 TaxID=3346749 RepID=UPI0036B2A53C